MILLDDAPPKPLPLPRTAETLGEQLRRMLGTGGLDLPLPGAGALLRRWRALAGFGRRDLVLARLAEGHTDAVAILAEAGLTPEPAALYGVWASKSGGTGSQLHNGLLTGSSRFCSGLTLLDRVLVTAGDQLVEVDLSAAGIERHPDAWQSVGMDASDSGDVVFDDVPAGRAVGPPGWYLARPGFVLGGTGVAALWLGGTAGVLDSVYESLLTKADEHQLAHLGALHAALRGSEELLAATAAVIEQIADPGLANDTCRASVERTARDAVDLAPRITGAGPLCRNRRFAQQVADLQVFIRQHHGERDLADLGRKVLEEMGS
ncbi:acyl-CoA dehydrogenase [Amycolatopsis ultiminotia]|uniref:Acyl-CoA dehydrogenase n=1 Tax=Amycolatopsis ultiminotia TaxID=543629 RepID=A0ABP6W8M2_9PSEU